MTTVNANTTSAVSRQFYTLADIACFYFVDAWQAT